MNAPGEQHWFRVEELGRQLAALSPEAISEKVAELASQGESPTVLTLLRTWLDVPAPTAPFGVGTSIGNRFVLLERIGEGAMGSVWRARQEIIGREVAVKLIHPSLVTPLLRARFLGEIEALGKLNHPGIVRIFDAGLHERTGQDSIPFFAMELLEGPTLNLWADEHRGNHGDVLRITAAICEALQAAHEHRIVHRDLKHSNIIVRPNGQPVVVDFGIARLAGVILGEEEKGAFSGTPRYAAPEQHLGRDGDFRSGESVDVYAVGVILFEMLTGRLLFSLSNCSSLTEMRRVVLESPVPALLEVLPDCSPLLSDVLAKALRRDPADRFYSMRALSRAIAQVIASSVAQTKPAPWYAGRGRAVPGTRWELLEKIGEGGTGQVWLGRHQQLGETRVFKFCDTEEKARTLKRELTLFRLLKDKVGCNPHFIPLREVSLDEPPYYLMMDYCEAQDLEAWSASQPGGLANLPETVRLEIIAQVAEALQAAHEAGIIHRDIKPANLLIRGDARAGQVHVFVADFGIGQIIINKLLQEGTRLGFSDTVAGLIGSPLQGTALYLAPEVLEGNAATARSDIYSLGVVFWQLMIGNLRAALDAADWSSHISDPLLREDLTRCLAGNPEKRFSSAGELAVSLRCLPARRQEAERRRLEATIRERTAYRLGLLRATGVATVLVGLFAVLAWLALTKSREAEAQRKEIAIDQAKSAFNELKALVDLKSGGVRARLAALVPEMETEGAPFESDLRATVIQALALPVFDSLEPPPRILGAEDRFSPDGVRLIKALSKSCEIVDLSSDPAAVRQFQAPSPPLSLSVNISGSAAGAICSDGNLHVWSESNLRTEAIIPGPFYARSFALSPVALSQSRKVAIAVSRLDGSVDVSLLGLTNPPLRLLRRSSATEDEYPESAPASMLAFSLSQEGVLAAAGPSSGILLFWKIQDRKNGELRSELAGTLWHPDTITCLCWNPVEDEIVTGCLDGVLRIWRFSFATHSIQTQPARSAVFESPIRSLAWSLDGGLIGVLLDSGELRLVPANSPDRRAVAIVNSHGAEHIAFIGGNTLMAWGTNGTGAWGSSEAPCFLERRLSPGDVSIIFHPQGSLIASSPDRIEFFNPSTLARTAGVPAQGRHPAVLEGTNFIFDSEDKWNSGFLIKDDAPAPTFRLSKSFRAGIGGALYVGSPSSRQIAWVDASALHCGKSRKQEEGLPIRLTTEPKLLAVSDTQPLTAWVAADRNVCVRDHRSGTNWSWTPSASPLGLAFSTEPDLLACRTESGVLFANPATHEVVSVMLPSPGTMAGPLAFSHDGQWLAVVGRERDVLIAPMPRPPVRWLNDGLALRKIFIDATPFRAPTARRILSLAWNSNDSRLASGTADGFVQCWNMSLLRKKMRLWNLDWGVDAPPNELGFAPIHVN